jgi:hypothetical protein
MAMGNALADMLKISREDAGKVVAPRYKSSDDTSSNLTSVQVP